MKKISKEKHDLGFTIVEVLVAVLIVMLFVLSAMSVTVKSIQVSRQALHFSQASFLLEEGAEAVRLVRDGGWTNISSLAAGTDYYPVFSGSAWNLSATPSTVGIFTRTVRSASVFRNGASDIASSGTADPGTKFITVTVSWTEGGQSISKSASFYIADLFS